MVLPLLYGLGARDFVDLVGYVINECPKCGVTGPFAVYNAKRKVTFYTLPTVSVREQQVIECRGCRQRFAVPPEMHDELARHLLSEEEVAARVRQGGNGIRAGSNGRPAGPTFYQVLQVDPAADPEVIEAAFKRLALKYHPDRSTDPEASNRMRAILEAKKVLSDDAKRRAYDRSLGLPPREPERPPPPPRPPGFRADDV